MRNKSVYRTVFILFYIAYGVLFIDFVIPPIAAEYGDWAGAVAVTLFALFALGCGYSGKKLWKDRKTGDKQE